MKNLVKTLFKAIQIQYILWSFIAFSAFLVCSCEDTFEEDISKETVPLNTPEDEYGFKDPNISFWWNSVYGASHYNLKVIKIDTAQNNALIKLVLDSNLTSTQFVMGLSPGSYEWGVVAYNGGYETDYYYRIFHIDSILDISNSSVLISQPSSNFVSNDISFTFTWQAFPGADHYNWELRLDGVHVESQTDISTNELTKDIDDEGTYEWTVYAYNSSSNSTSLKTWRTIIIDRSKPNAPSLLLPAQIDTLYNADLVSDKVEFSWDPVTDDGSVISYRIYFASDTLFTNVLDSFDISGATYLWEPVGGIDNQYFWRMKSIDAAGNQSPYSSERIFWYYDE